MAFFIKNKGKYYAFNDNSTIIINTKNFEDNKSSDLKFGSATEPIKNGEVFKSMKNAFKDTGEMAGKIIYDSAHLTNNKTMNKVFGTTSAIMNGATASIAAPVSSVVAGGMALKNKINKDK